MPNKTPKTIGLIGSSIANATARNAICRYVAVLNLFATRGALDASSPIDGDIEWNSFEYKAEYYALKAEGYLNGEQCRTISHPNFEKDTEIISMPTITVSGAIKLAELSDYLWNTSNTGKTMRTLTQALWIALGAVLGWLGTAYFSK